MQLLYRTLVAPVPAEIRRVVSAHRLLWGDFFPKAWNTTPLDAKIAWLLFINNTIAVITIFEIFILKSR